MNISAFVKYCFVMDMKQEPAAGLLGSEFQFVVDCWENPT